MNTFSKLSDIRRMLAIKGEVKQLALNAAEEPLELRKQKLQALRMEWFAIKDRMEKLPIY